MDETTLSEFFDDEFGEVSKLSGDDLFSILESLNDVVDVPPLDETTFGLKEETKRAKSNSRLVSQKSTSSSTTLQGLSEDQTETETPGSSPKRKRPKTASTTTTATTTTTTASSDQEAINGSSDGQGKISHITVERNRRKQMNEHLTVLRSLMPCFYVKRGDQASIIGGVVDYINELQQVLQSLEAKKQRKIYNEVLSPRLVSSSPRPSPPLLSPRKPPLSPRLSLPVSPRTPQPGSPYKPRLQQGGGGYGLMAGSPTAMALPCANSLEPSPTSSSSTTTTSSNIMNHINDAVNELSANSKSEIADVEVKFSGSNLLLKTVSPRIPGQAAKIIAAIEDLSLEILNVNISTVDDTMFNSFTIKIGIECQLSAEELAHHIQQTFCQVH